jgi:uncharacterized membrane protein YdjX (TVP38/TMEM64 family)
VRDKQQTKFIKDILRIFLVGVFFVVLVFVLQHPFVRAKIFDVQNWRQDSQSMGQAGVYYFFSLFCLANSLGVPRLWICAIAGGLYGALDGILIAFPATVLGASVNFIAGRWMLRGPLKRRLPARMLSWHDHYAEKGFYWLLLLRLFPLSNAMLVNLISGASKMRYRDFLGATIIGYLPFTVTFALFGSSAAKGKWSQFFWGLLLFIAVVAGRWIYRKRSKGQGAVPDA